MLWVGGTNELQSEIISSLVSDLIATTEQHGLMGGVVDSSWNGCLCVGGAMFNGLFGIAYLGIRELPESFSDLPSRTAHGIVINSESIDGSGHTAGDCGTFPPIYI